MKITHLKDFARGWFIGDFSPSLLRTCAFEVGIKSYRAGEREPIHYHKISTEYTVVVSGRFAINGKSYAEGDIIVLDPNEPADFQCINTGKTVVIKLPSVPHDKYLQGVEI